MYCRRGDGFIFFLRLGTPFPRGIDSSRWLDPGFEFHNNYPSPPHPTNSLQREVSSLNELGHLRCFNFVNPFHQPFHLHQLICQKLYCRRSKESTKDECVIPPFICSWKWLTLCATSSLHHGVRRLSRS